VPPAAIAAAGCSKPAATRPSSSASAAPFDLVLRSCKACSLDDAIEAVAPAVGPSTAIPGEEPASTLGVARSNVIERRWKIVSPRGNRA
jgi:hypothetical protein